MGNKRVCGSHSRSMLGLEPGVEPERSLQEEDSAGSTVVGGTSAGRFPGVEAQVASTEPAHP